MRTVFTQLETPWRTAALLRFVGQWAAQQRGLLREPLALELDSGLGVEVPFSGCIRGVQIRIRAAGPLKRAHASVVLGASASRADWAYTFHLLRTMHAETSGVIAEGEVTGDGKRASGERLDLRDLDEATAYLRAEKSLEATLAQIVRGLHERGRPFVALPGIGHDLLVLPDEVATKGAARERAFDFEGRLARRAARYFRAERGSRSAAPDGTAFSGWNLADAILEKASWVAIAAAPGERGAEAAMVPWRAFVEGMREQLESVSAREDLVYVEGARGEGRSRAARLRSQGVPWSSWMQEHGGGKRGMGLQGLGAAG